MEMTNYAFFCSLVLLACVNSIEAVNIIKPLPRNTFEISGSEVNITCIFVGDNGQPPVRVKFQRRKEVGLDWFDIPDTERVYQTNKTEGNKTFATLHFMNTTAQDDKSKGGYSCVGYSSTGGKPVRHRFTLRVTPREDLPVARVMPNLIVSYGDSARLYCNLTHKNNKITTPIDKVTYLKNNEPVKVTNDVTQPLIIHSVRAREGGKYECRIVVLLHSQKPYEVISSSADLHIRVRFPIKESKLIADIGDSVALVCSAEGFPLNVEWKKNQPGSAAIIKPEGRFTLLLGECSYCDSILMIQNVTAEDAGNYSCSASDNSGQQIFLVKVNAANSTSVNVAVTTMASYYVTASLPAFLWTWWPLIWQ